MILAVYRGEDHGHAAQKDTRSSGIASAWAPLLRKYAPRHLNNNSSWSTKMLPPTLRSPIDRIATVVCYLATIAGRLPLADLFAVPSVRDREACRKWLVAVCSAADVIADATTLRTDDAIVDLLGWCVIDANAFEGLHHLIVLMLDRTADSPILPSDLHPGLLTAIERAEVIPLDVAKRVKLYVNLGRSVGLLK